MFKAMTKTIRIGTRKSPLAIWQAKKVQEILSAKQINSVLIEIRSDGDNNQNTPLYAMGITGIFTKSLDIALLENRIDIAVHSMKDVPTILCDGLIQAAVLKRGLSQDILIKSSNAFIGDHGTIATGSLRRAALWKNRFPKSHIIELRGNVQTRLEKLNNPKTDGIIMAAAGLERLGIIQKYQESLDWMIPAPAQGAIMVVCRFEDRAIQALCASFNHGPTDLCTGVEREFLKTLEGGCTAPIGALAKIEANILSFKGVLLSVDGQQKLDIEEQCHIDNIALFGRQCADKILCNGGNALMAEIKTQMP